MHTAIADNIRSYFIRNKKKAALLAHICKYFKEHLENEFHGLSQIKEAIVLVAKILPQWLRVNEKHSNGPLL